MGSLLTTATLTSCHGLGTECPSDPNTEGWTFSPAGGTAGAACPGATGPGEPGLALIPRPRPGLPTATWLTGFPPCSGHELTSAPLTGRGEGVGRAQATHCAGSPPSPVPQDNGRASASGHSWWGGGGGRSTRRGRRRREGSRAEEHLGPQPPSPRTWLRPLWSPSARLSGRKGGKRVWREGARAQLLGRGRSGSC